jgi:hypothetical protein
LVLEKHATGTRAITAATKSSAPGSGPDG